MSQTTATRLMLGYCVLVTTLLAALTIRQAVSHQARISVEELEVHRINVRERDGTLRMTISNTDSGPGIIVKGREFPHPSRRSAGILFFNDEGTENGGLIFGGRNEDGKVANYGHLSFDQYEQDQVVVLEQNDDGGKRDATLSFWDRPDTALPWDLADRMNTPEGRAEADKLRSTGGFGHPRLLIGKTDDSVATVSLKDAKGRARLVMKVAPGGDASIEFLDENGTTVRTITP